MKMREFIRLHREELDKLIKDAGLTSYSLNDNDRHEHIINDEGLSRWARSEGVRV